MDGSYSSKTFAPGYGEYVTTNDHELEAVAIALPTDARSESLPAELETLLTGAMDSFEAAGAEQWDVVVETAAAMTSAWHDYQAGGVPRFLDAQMTAALIDLLAAVDIRGAQETRQAAVKVAQAALDLQLLYRPLAEFELMRFNLLTHQVLVDAAAADLGGVTSDVTTLEWVLDRFVHTLSKIDSGNIEAQLDYLRNAVDAKDLALASEAATQLQDTISVVKLSAV